MGYRSIHEIKEANRRAGEFFFSPGTMHFFASKVLPTVYGGRYFITSERFGSTAQRVYSVRECDELGFITNVPNGNEFRTRTRARTFVKKLCTPAVR